MWRPRILLTKFILKDHSAKATEAALTSVEGRLLERRSHGSRESKAQAGHPSPLHAAL